MKHLVMIVDDMTDMPAILTEVPISNTGHQDDFQCIKSLIFPDDLWDPAIDWKLWHAVIIYNLKKLIAEQVSVYRRTNIYPTGA